MGGYVQKRRAAAKPPTGADAHGIDARSATPGHSDRPDDSAVQSLLQLRQALDDSPRVQQHAALQRALDQRAAAPAKKKSKEKPALQMKGVAINDDAGLEREADVMGARASAAPALAADASAFAPARAGGWAAIIQRNGPDTKTAESKSTQDTKTAAPKPAPDTKVAAPKPQGAWGAGAPKITPQKQSTTTSKKQSTTAAAPKKKRSEDEIWTDIRFWQSEVERFRETVDKKTSPYSIWDIKDGLTRTQLEDLINALEGTRDARSEVSRLHKDELNEPDPKDHATAILVTQSKLTQALEALEKF